jgi:hypothetical protein
MKYAPGAKLIWERANGSKNGNKERHMKLSTIIAEIHNMESKDLDKVVEAVKYARSQAHRQMANTLRSGAYGHFTCNDWED